MPNLIDRLTGNLTDAESDQKIAIHPFTAAFQEWGRGKVQAAEVIAVFALTAAQQAQVSTLAALWTAAPERTEFMRIFKDLVYMGERNLHSRYRDIAYINARLQEAVTDQGGTLP